MSQMANAISRLESQEREKLPSQPKMTLRSGKEVGVGTGRVPAPNGKWLTRP